MTIDGHDARLNASADSGQGARNFVGAGAHRDEVHELLGRDLRAFAEGDAVVGGQLRSVDEGGAGVAGRDKESLQCTERQDLGAGAGQFTLVEHYEVGRRSVEETTEETTQQLGQGHEGTNNVGDFTGRDVDREGYKVASEGQLDLLGNGDTGLVLGFGC